MNHTPEHNYNTGTDRDIEIISGVNVNGNLVSIYAQSFRENFNYPCLTDYMSGETLTYGQFARNIARLHLLFREAGIQKGDKIALMGKNSVTWVTIFFATITYGAVIVPILAEFNPRDAEHIINHSEARLLFVSENIFTQLGFDSIPKISAALSLDTKKLLAARTDGDSNAEVWSRRLENLDSLFASTYPQGFNSEHIDYPLPDMDNVVLINYTSGTTGYSKGVMLTLRNLWGNVTFGIRSRLHFPRSRALAFLPLAHAYGCAFDLLVPLAVGTHVTLLGVLPSPNVLLKAFAQVRPSLVICVPLILEKIYKRQIVPSMSRPFVQWAVKKPWLKKFVYDSVRRKLIKAFGGKFEEVIVGGAPLNPEVEDFLLKIKFPVTVGYGMTECGPLISYTPWRRFVPHSSGHVLDGLMEVRIDSENPREISGEILVRGTNVMAGYYKNPEITAETIDSDGWLHTGDIGTVCGDDCGTISIRGRSKAMILTGTGQNIYPEEIEAKLSNMPYVGECLIVERGGRLIGLVYPDNDAMTENNVDGSQLPKIMDDARRHVNTLVAPYEQIDRIELVENEFEKAPKRSIKRFLYS